MKRFRSKVDAWIMILLAAAIAGQFLALVAIFATEQPVEGKAIAAVALLLGITLITWTLVQTHYTVAGDTLKITCGPFRFSVPISEITAVEETRSPLSSPALSLDRLRIRYGKNKRVMISPDDKRGFLRAIGQSLGK